MKPKLAVLITHPIQYYAPLYREIASRQNVDIHVIFLSDAGASAYHDKGFGISVSWDIPLLEGYTYTILEPGLSLEKLGFWQRYSPKLVKLLEGIKPDYLLLYGYASRMNWVAQRWASCNKCPVLYTSDSNANNSRSSWKSLVKKAVVSHFFKGVSFFLSTSEANADYLRLFGVPQRRITRIPFAIDYERWAKDARAQQGERKYDFAWAGKFVPIKRTLDFILALRSVAGRREVGVRGLLIGDGPLRGEIEASLRELPTNCYVDYVGFVNQKDMPATLQQANTFVFSSERDAYGLIATEAAAAGLALIVADRIGCVGDTVLARPNVNALIYPPGDVDALASAMLMLIDEPETRISMQRASEEIAKQHDVTIAVAIIEDLVLSPEGSDHSAGGDSSIPLNGSAK